MLARLWHRLIYGPARSYIGRVRRSEVVKKSETVGEIGLTDWLGNPIMQGSRIVYPAEVRYPGGKSVQMTLATVIYVLDDGAIVQVHTRSRTGKPRDRQRTRVKLSLVGLANSTVIGEDAIG